MWWDVLATGRVFLYCSAMPARWKSDRPMSRQEFEALFPDDAACARYLVERRWPDGFVCPVCRARKGWALKHDRPAWECAGCRRQTSVTAGTVMHGSHLPLRTWFMAAHIVASHSNGISAIQLQAQVGIGSYKAAWLLLHKLRRAMVDPDRGLLQEIVEVDETEIPFRRKTDPVEHPAGESGSPKKIKVVGAVELSQDGHPRRIRLERISDRSSKTLHGFVGRMVEPGAHVITDGLISYENMPNNTHEPELSPAERHTRSFTGCIAYSQTSSGGRRACSTAFARSTSNATSTSSSSAGTEDDIREVPWTPSSGSLSVSCPPPIATLSSIEPDQANRGLAPPL